MSKSVIIFIVVLIASVAWPMHSSAQSKPRWASKGVSYINKQRSNDSYSFEMFYSHDVDISRLKEERVTTIENYLTETYGAKPFSFEVQTYNTDPLIYKITYVGADGQKYNVVARLVDEYEEFNDFELNVYEFQFYQLYAISRPNVTPIFDQFSITRQYEFAERSLGFVPGLSQLYKGQNTKAYVIIGGEVAFLGAALYFDWQRRDCRNMRYEEPFFANSWRSKETAWRNFEIGAFSCAAALYIYNVIDAFKSKGAPQVVVKKTQPPVSYSLLPYFAPEEAGVSLVLNF